MAYQTPGFAIPNCRAASTGLSTKQFYFVRATTGDTVNVFTAAGLLPLGVLQDKPTKANQACQVMGTGVSRVVAGGTLAPGDRVRVDSTSRAVKWTAGSTTHFVAGQVAPDGGASASGLATVILNCLAPALS